METWNVLRRWNTNRREFWLIESGPMSTSNTYTLLLSQEDVQSVLTMKDAIDAMATAFSDHAQEKTQIVKRQYLRPTSGRIGFMSAYVESISSAGVKVVSTFHDNPSKYGLPSITALVVLSDTETGFPLAIMDGTSLTMIRTGAASAIATKYLARKGSSTVGIIGLGAQGKGQLMALAEVCRIEKAYCFARKKNHREEFADHMSEKLGIDVRPVDSAQDAVRNVDVIAISTPSMTPVIMDDWVTSGTHINTVGGSSKGEQEIATAIFQRSKIVVDDFENASSLGQITQPIAKGELRKDDIYAELGELVLRKKEGRTSNDEITVFVSSGLAIQDVATAHLVCEKARSRGIGTQFRFL